ncbi:MAG TPA: hypothetical protein VHW71_02360 [Steroidobacteraceae bacterium]|jgi:hypothetical protein|nr:hypothetical protein [Steroidobacteraceae bacterium]
MKAWIVAGLLVALLGCSTSPSKLGLQLRPYVGQNITAVSAVLGDPESERKTVAEVHYTWTVDNRVTMTQPRLGVNLEDVMRAQFSVTPEAQDVTMHYVCNLQVVTSQDGTIKAFHTDGNQGCNRFVTALDM